MKKIVILSSAAIAGLFIAASAQAQVVVNGATGYGGPVNVVAGAAGLNDLVIHAGYNAGDFYKGYNEYPTNLGIDDASITAIQNYALTYGPSSQGYAANNQNSPSYTFLNTNTGFQYSNGSSVANYLGADAAGAALLDTANNVPGTIYNATGYINITDDLVDQDFTFTINNADDAGRVSIGGQTVIEDNYFGAAGGLAFSNTATVSFQSAGLYAIDVLTYQNGGGQNFSFNVTPNTIGGSAFTYNIAAAPEPSTWAMLLAGAAALVVISRRRASKA